MAEFDALVLVGASKRLKNKHFLKLGTKTVIEYVIQNLIDLRVFTNIYVSTVKPLALKNVIQIHDSIGAGPVSGFFISLKYLKNPVFLVGGDMPFVQKNAVMRIISTYNNHSVIPRWKNGYIEPLHALYNIKNFPDLHTTRSLHELITKIDKRYVSAEELNAITFFNINTWKDYITAKALLENLK